MYERMLDKSIKPTYEEMAAYCGASSVLFKELNESLSDKFKTERTIDFPYGNKYGYGVAHRIKKKLICYIFAENGAFTVMLHLPTDRFEAVRGSVCEYTREIIDGRYPCGDGGWIHYRVFDREKLADITLLINEKFKTE